MLRSHRRVEHSGPAGGEGSTGVPQPGHGATCCPPAWPRGPELWPRGQRRQRERGQACERSAPQRRDLVSSPLIPRSSPCRWHRCPPRQRAGTRRSGGHVSPRGELASRPHSGGHRPPPGTCRVTGSPSLVWGFAARAAGVAWQLPWDLRDIGACWQQGSVPREPLPDVPLGTRLLPPSLVNRMWSHPNAGVPVPHRSPATPQGSSSGAAVPVPPSPAGRCCPGRARGRSCRGAGHVSRPGPLPWLSPLVPSAVLTPENGQWEGDTGTRGPLPPSPGCRPARVTPDCSSSLGVSASSRPPPCPPGRPWGAGVSLVPQKTPRNGGVPRGKVPTPVPRSARSWLPSPRRKS